MEINDFEKDNHEVEPEFKEISNPEEIGLENGIADQSEKKPYNWKKEALEWVEAIVFSVLVSLFIVKFICVPVKVDGRSMDPTLHDGDRLIVLKLNYQPKFGDIIVFDPPDSVNTPYVKRVIALPGQTIDFNFNKGEVYLDGQKLEEDYISELTKQGKQSDYPKTVPEDSIFVLGDNRNNSRDSRMIGMIPENRIIGCAAFRIWPLSSFGFLK